MGSTGTQDCLPQSPQPVTVSHSKELLPMFSNKGVAVMYTGLSLCQPFCPCFEAHVQGVCTKTVVHPNHLGNKWELLVSELVKNDMRKTCPNVMAIKQATVEQGEVEVNCQDNGSQLQHADKSHTDC